MCAGTGGSGQGTNSFGASRTHSSIAVLETPPRLRRFQRLPVLRILGILGRAQDSLQRAAGSEKSHLTLLFANCSYFFEACACSAPIDAASNSSTDVTYELRKQLYE
jgi:hypothetical protein